MSEATGAAAGSLLPAGGREHDVERARLLAGALSPDAATFTVLVLDGEPATKSRPRFNRNGRAYKADADTEAEARTGWQFRRAFRQPMVGNVAIGCVFFRPDRRQIDVDNMLKHVCDAANGIAWVDDAQITAVYGVAELDVEDPRTLVVVTKHRSSLDRAPAKKRTSRQGRGVRRP
jgi:Holliday junction resolvase RusA-like endonuclease